MAQFIIAIETDEPNIKSAKRLILNFQKSKHVKDFRIKPCIFSTVDDLDRIIR
jgi:hypothetical protein